MLTGVALGCALLSKYTAILILPGSVDFFIAKSHQAAIYFFKRCLFGVTFSVAGILVGNYLELPA